MYEAIILNSLYLDIEKKYLKFHSSFLRVPHLNFSKSSADDAVKHFGSNHRVQKPPFHRHRHRGKDLFKHALACISKLEAILYKYFQNVKVSETF